MIKIIDSNKNRIKRHIRVMILDEIENVNNALLPAFLDVRILGKLVDCCHKCRY